MGQDGTRRSTGLGRLAKLKSWLTVSEAARYLSVTFGEEVAEADVLRLALDGHLRLSVRFVNGATVRRHQPVTPQELQELVQAIERRRVERGRQVVTGVATPSTDPADPGRPARPLTEAELVFPIGDDVYDLPLEGGERLDVEHRYQSLTDGPDVTGIWLDATLIETADGVRLEVMERFTEQDCELQPPYLNPANFFPPGTLGEGAVLVLRMSSLRAFEQKLNDDFGTPGHIDSKPVTTRERSTLLTLLAVLAERPPVDLSRPSKAAIEIEAYTAEKGVRIAARTIEDHIKRIPEALERRRQD